MSIKKDRKGEYTLTCDVCGEHEDGFGSFEAAVEYKKLSGWRARKDDFGRWIDRCPDCAANRR